MGGPGARPPRFLSRETSMNSRSRPSIPGTTLSSRTSPSARGPGAAGKLWREEEGGVTRRTGTVGREMTTAWVEVGRSVRGSIAGRAGAWGAAAIGIGAVDGGPDGRDAGGAAGGVAGVAGGAGGAA